ncbi:MAG: FadR family transcriptional regulator [Thermomicrobiales bacterium]|nr:FadR family transcriptional regulator [Thermomicrobiales bacterium]
MSFSAVTVVRPYEQIVRQIQSAIREKGLSEGDRLPTERELAETFGVSRSVVREAIKVLSAQGLVEARQGSGLYVLNRPIESVTRAIVLSVAPEEDAIGKLFEFRGLLEADAARLAAGRATPRQIEALWQCLEHYEAGPDGQPNWERFADVDEAIHALICAAANNPYLEMMVASVRGMMQDVVVLIADHPGSIDEAMRHHRQIIEAIAAGDTEGAGQVMAQHVAYSASVVQSQIEVSSRHLSKEESAIE